MGNYSTLHGTITIEGIKNYCKFEELWTEEMVNWVSFEKLFIQQQWKGSNLIHLHIHPARNKFKLLGYPDAFEEFFSFFKRNNDIIEYATFIADVEDKCFFKFDVNLYEDNTFEYKLLRLDEIDNNEQHYKWHKSFLDTLPQYVEDA